MQFTTPANGRRYANTKWEIPDAAPPPENRRTRVKGLFAVRGRIEYPGTVMSDHEDDNSETLHLLRSFRNAERLRRSIQAGEARGRFTAKQERSNDQQPSHPALGRGR
jgi:hypothetical protein